MNIRQLRKLLEFWVEILNLPEWKIEVKWGTKKNLEECVGRNYFSIEELDSLILIDKNGDDIEGTLVHELLHLVLDGHRDVDLTNKYDPMLERAINRTAAAMIKLVGRSTFEVTN